MSRRFNDMYFSLTDEEREEFDADYEEAENICERFENSIKTKDVGQIKVLLAVSEAMEPKYV